MSIISFVFELICGISSSELLERFPIAQRAVEVQQQPVEEAVQITRGGLVGTISRRAGLEALWTNVLDCFDHLHTRPDNASRYLHVH